MSSFPDIEARQVALLKTVTEEHVGTEVPADRPAAFVRVWVTGGSALQRVFERPTVTVTAEAQTSTAAAALANTCRDKFLEVYGAAGELTRPYFDPDPDTNNPRYTFVFRTRNRAND